MDDALKLMLNEENNVALQVETQDLDSTMMSFDVIRNQKDKICALTLLREQRGKTKFLRTTRTYFEAEFP